MQKFNRRELLKLGGAAAAAELASLGLQGCNVSKFIPSVGSGCSKLTDIEHVVILIQENRSFDHYFGSYRGVRGFSEQSAAFQQPDPANTTNSPVGKLLPFHLDTSQANAACTHDISHDWVPQHQSWDNGAMDGFVSSRLAIDSNDAVLSMGYYTRADIPYYYGLADAFTICDNYFCSVIGPDRSQSPVHDGGIARPGWKKRWTGFADNRHQSRRFLWASDLYHHAGATSGTGNFLEGLLLAG